MAAGTVTPQGGAGAVRHAWYASAWALVGWMVVAKLLMHLLTASRYGYFRDEMYFMACGEHLDWGYVDQPPIIGLAAWFTRHFIGTSVAALRVLPALAGAGVMVVTAGIARELGAKRFGMALAAGCAGFAGVCVVMHHLFTMNAFDPLIWTGCAYVLVKIINTGNQKLWIWFGVIAGIGLENKYAIAVFGAGVVLGVLLTPERRAFGRPWLWMAGALAALIFLPNVIWNIRHGWPFLELMRNVRTLGENTEISPLGFVAQQVLVMNPATLPIWGAGLLWVFFGRAGKKYRALGWAWLFTVGFFLVAKGKNYYPTPAYPMIFAAGAVAIERFSVRAGRGWVKPLVAGVPLLAFLVLMPVVVPVLSVESYLKYQRALHLSLPTTEKSHALSPLPQYYADDFGWEEMVAAVAKVYYSLPPEERAKAAIFANNFGEGGAVDLIGPRYGLPKAIGNQQNYFLWGPRNYTGEVMIILGDTWEGLGDKCEQKYIGAQLYHRYAEPWENKPVLVCKGLKWDLREIWPRVKHYN